MADLLLELFSEEIPARMQADAMAYLQKSLQEKLGQATKGFVTPRRVAAIVENIPAVQPDINTELKGPKIGAPQAAIDGFIKKSGMKLEELTQQDGVYVAKIFQKGKPTAEILKPLIEEILKAFPWPKSMRWGNGETSWVRPLHSILCIFDGNVVPVEFAGVKAGNTTRGHRFLSTSDITIKSAGEYEAALEKAFVIADREKRKAEILKQATAICSAGDWRLATGDALLEEVTGLVEWPTVMVGTIDKNYMDLPKEVLVSEMRAHQKYFALETKDGALADKFLITSNMKKDAEKNIIAGNERVLRARLADGRFFWDQDRKRSLDDMAKSLSNITYHAKLGSVGDKVERVKALAVELVDPVYSSLRGAQATKQSSLDRHAPEGAHDDVQRAAALCKADLVSGMVGEFPELQGVMGRYYAQGKETQAVADAIRDHYLPLGPSSPVPTAPVSVCVALAEKLDTLISMFAIGEKPTGSKDPFALRRAALGVIRIVLENNIRLPLLPLLSAAPLREIALYKAQANLEKKVDVQLHSADIEAHKVGKYLTVNESACEDIPEGTADALAQSLLVFFHDRLIVQLKDSGIRHDVIKAVVADGDDDLVRIVNRAKAVQAFLDTDDGRNLLAGYKRAANILAIEEKKDKKTYQGTLVDIKLKETAELALTENLNRLSLKISELSRKEQFTDIMGILAELRKPLDLFFENTMVNCDDTALRESRLHLLGAIKSNMNTVADFSKIEGDAKEQRKAA